MKQKVTVLGCGMVGAAMAADLAADEKLDVTVVDRSPENLSQCSEVATLKATRKDLGTPDAIQEAIADADMVIGAMPSALGLQTLRAVLESGKNYCDISFMEQDAGQLDALARERGAIAVFDCGVAPGLSNMIVGHCHARFDKTHNVEIYVGGLPKTRTWPFQYKAPFAPSDVIEEYTRPARLVENGRVVTKPALSEPQPIDFAQVGTLEAFNTDGLRTLIRNIDAPCMKEKTLRYPGHAEIMRVLSAMGLFSGNEIDVKGARIAPRDVTAALMFPLWKYQPGELEFTVMRVIVEGEQNGETVRHTVDLYDETDPETGRSSMARTTGMPNVIVARMILDGRITSPGVHAPETLGEQEGILDQVMGEMSERGVDLAVIDEPVPPAESAATG